MVDRISLIKALDPILEPDGTQALLIRDALDKVLYEAVPTLPYTAVKDLTEHARTDLNVIINLLSPAKAKQLSAKWEPDRKLDSDVGPYLKRDLLELLHLKRDPYKPIKISLEEARQNSSRYLSLIQYTMPTKDCEKLLKLWDKELKPFPKGRKAISGRLVDLLNGESPIKKPKSIKTPLKTQEDRQPVSRGSKGAPKAKAA